MSVESQVREAKSPQEAMLRIATALDVILEAVLKQPAANDGWGEWDPVPQGFDPEPAAYKEVTDDEVGTTTIHIPTPSPEKWMSRQQFALGRLQLNDYMESTNQPLPDGFDNWCDWYAKLGPYALYVADRECIMSYDTTARQVMVQDVEEDNPTVAQEMARDVLKEPAADGPGGIGMSADLMGGSPNPVRMGG